MRESEELKAVEEVQGLDLSDQVVLKVEVRRIIAHLCMHACKSWSTALHRHKHKHVRARAHTRRTNTGCSS